MLHSIFKTVIKSASGTEPFSVEGGIEGKYIHASVRRIGRGRGSTGFGNARAVKNEFERILERQALRLKALSKKSNDDNLDIYALTKEDLLGPDPASAFAHSEAHNELKEQIGLESVKEAVGHLVGLMSTNYTRELDGKPILDISLNKAFLGPPGTGKVGLSIYSIKKFENENC
jgi:AAA lid domain